MIHEQPFISSLRSVVVHLIKHDRFLYAKVMPIATEYDARRWQSLSVAEKTQYIRDLQGCLDELTAYYEKYPHAWSRQRFANFVAALQEYSAELAGQG